VEQRKEEVARREKDRMAEKLVKKIRIPLGLASRQ